MRIHWLRHVPFEGLGCIESWATKRGHELTSTCQYEEDQLPAVDEIDWLIVMGGPMSVHDVAEFSWLTEEREFIKAAIDRGKIVLGVCLGAQLIAGVLGARVFPGVEKEIGWYPITNTGGRPREGIAAILPEGLEVFHWHGETFELPAGALRLASSAVCENQAFTYGEKVLGLQFHLEMTVAGVRGLIEHCGREIAPDPHIQAADEMLGGEDRYARINAVMDRLLEHLEDQL